MLNYLWLALGILVGFMVLFFLTDLFLKKGKKTTAPKPEKETPKPTAVKDTPAAIKPVPTPTEKVAPIYNSDLADELDDIIKQNSPEDQTRIQIGKHVRAKSNIAQYLETKNYHTFDFHEGAVNPDEAATGDDKMTFTKEDYKRIVALSNIDTKK